MSNKLPNEKSEVSGKNQHKSFKPALKKKKRGRAKKNLLDKKVKNKSTGEMHSNVSRPDEKKIEKDPFLDTIAKCKKMDLEKVTRFWQNNPNKEVCAMLAAITEVVQEKNSSETETAAAYFSALLMTLDTCKLECKSSIIFLLSMFVPQLSPVVVKEKFDLVATLLCDVLQSSCDDSDSPTALVKSTLVTLSVLLRYVKCSDWSQLRCQEHFKALLNFTSHIRPKVRKAAQEAVATVLGGDHKHPGASICSKFCCGKLEKIESSSLCHLMLLAGLTAHTFPSKDLEKLCELILTHISLAAPEDTITRSVGLQTIGKIFSNSPSIHSLPLTLNHQILNQVRACWQQSVYDCSEFPHHWFSVMQQGVANLISKCGKVNENNLAIYVTQVFKLCEDAFKWMSDHKEYACKVVTACLNHLSKLFEGSRNFSDEVSKSLTKISDLLVGGLSESHKHAWDQVLSFFQMGFSNFLTAAVANKAIVRMTEMQKIPQFKHKAELDAALGVAIKTYGPGCLLQALTLKVGDMKELTKIVELLEEHISHAELTHFFTQIKPLAEKCGKANKRLLWRLLPSYCRFPTDITSALSSEHAKILGDMLLLRGAEHSDLRISVIRAIGNLVTTSQDTNRLRKLGKNFLSLLSNVYLECGHKLKEGASKQQQVAKNQEQQVAIEVMSSYVKLLPSDVCAHHYRNAHQSYLELTTAKPDDQKDKTRDTRALALFDLMITCVAHVTGDDLDEACDAVLTMISDSELEHSRQKKAYRLLEQICAANNENFVVSNIDKLRASFQKAKSVCAESSKASRLRALGHVVALFDDGERRREFIGDVVLPECVSSLRANFNEKCKMLAFDMLVRMARAYGELDKYVDRVLEGLQVESAILNSCTILALSRLAFELKDEVSGEAMDRCTEMVVQFLTTNTREISKAALGYISVVMSLGESHQALLTRHAESVVRAVAGWKGDTMRHFRTRLSILLQRLVRKLGREVVESWCSEELKKHLKHDDDVTSKRKADDVSDEATAKKRQKTILPPRPKTSNGGKKNKNKKKSGGNKKQHHGKRRN